MNNYPNFKNYYPYNNMNNNTNLNYNMYNKNDINTYEMQDNSKNAESLYDPYNGFIRGNLFKSLFDPYKIKEPYDVKPMNEQAKLLTNIDALCFAMTDLNLYLDIYPDSRDAINLFNQYREEKKNLTDEYESKYGPISLDSKSLNSYPWSWDNMPWPWDN
ncbi:MAG: spore coat protein CotJB [bacterium]|nr:spore coat protein CotJB [bacterium]